MCPPLLWSKNEIILYVVDIQDYLRWFAAVCQQKRSSFEDHFGWKMGLEPTTFGTTIRRSNQLSYVHRFTARFFRTACKFNTLFDYCKIFAADSSRKRGTVRLRFLFFRCPQGDLSGMGRFAGLPFSGRRRPASGGPLFLADYLINLPDKERLWKNVPVSSGSTGGRCS